MPLKRSHDECRQLLTGLLCYINGYMSYFISDIEKVSYFLRVSVMNRHEHSHILNARDVKKMSRE